MSAEAADLALRVDRAISALTETLNNFDPKPRAWSAASRKLAALPAGEREDAAAVLLALRAALLLDQSGGLGALTWYELKSQTRLTDDRLGHALSVMIPRLVRSRDGGDKRIYFLPRGLRSKLRASVACVVVARAAQRPAPAPRRS